MAIVSAIDVYTTLDQMGNPRVTGWFDVEYRESYIAAGIGIDLSPNFRQIRDIIARPTSGVYNVLAVGNEDTYGTPVSTRIKLLEAASGNISIISGQSQALSGVTAVWSGFVAAAPLGELRAVAISGSRSRLLVYGY